MKTLLFGIFLILVLGIGGFVYRNIVEHPIQPVACPLDAKVCPDGTSVTRTGSSCTFPACPAPNVSLADIKIAFALPEGFTDCPLTADFHATAVACYKRITASSTAPNTILINRYIISASTTPLEVIKKTAISGTSGLPVSATSFTSTTLGTHRFTIAMIERFEGVVDVAYYLARGNDVLRFDAIDNGADWTNPNLDIATLPTQAALRQMLATLQGE